MSNNLAYQEDMRTELINGEIVSMSPSATTKHNFIINNLMLIFGNYLLGKNCTPFSDGVDVYLTEKNIFIPDMMIVCNPDKISDDGIHGAPDLVVEVLSPSTTKNDRFRKKDVYEACGVREYWLVDPSNKTLEQYILTDSKFTIKEIYAVHPDYYLNKLTDEEKTAIPTEFKCSLYDDLTIKVADVFYRVK